MVTTSILDVHRGTASALRQWAAGQLHPLRAARVAPRDGEPYGRRVLSVDAQGEVMLASWRSGATCAPHDHGGARGMVLVLEGRLTETVQTPFRGGLRPGPSRTVTAGDLLHVEPRMVHEMRADDEALTLHVYVPRVRPMRVYDRVSCATLHVADACGAWVPSDPSLVLERCSWQDDKDVDLPPEHRP